MISEEHLQLLKAQHTKELSTLQLRRILHYLDQEKITLLSQKDLLYPSSFLELKKPPSLLYVKGQLPSNLSSAVTLVGTRNASSYGKGQAHKIAKELASVGIPIISGLARGIDSAAHLGALVSGSTVAIIASGFSQLYPKENQKLAHDITQRGALISEYSPFIPPTRFTFIQRNRLLAALGQCTFLVESPEKGGSMVTIEIAKSLKRPLFALPATVDMPSFKGNFKLLKERSAYLCEESQDILDHLIKFSLLQNSATLLEKKSSFLPLLSSEEKRVYQFINEKEKGLEELLLLTQLPIMQLNALLTSLLLQGTIEELTGKMYKKK